MPQDDATRWDKRYRDRDHQTYYPVRSFLLDVYQYIPAYGRVLDVAMGLGGNASYLVQRGYRVIGVDISRVALHQVRQRCPGVSPILADLTQIHFPKGSFSGILNFYYLQRDLWEEFDRILQPGGVLILETLMKDMCSIKPELDPRYLLEPGELGAAFKHWEVLFYREGWQPRHSKSQKCVASMVARKPV